MKKLLLFKVFFALLLLLLSYALTVRYNLAQSAYGEEPVSSNCVLTKVGDPKTPPPQLPPQCPLPSSSTACSQVSKLQLAYDDTARNRHIPVTVWACDKPSPLVVFAAGRSRGPDFYERYENAIASQGFTVAAPNFPVNNGSDWPGEVNDIKYVIGKLQQESQLQGKISGGGIGLVGHSDGGIVALMAGFNPSLKDSRITAVISADGATEPRESSGPPLLLIHGTLDAIENISSSINAYNSLSAPVKYLAKVIGADHYLYVIQNQTQTPALDAITGAFLKHQLSGCDDSISNIVNNQYKAVIDLQQSGSDAGGQPCGVAAGDGSAGWPFPIKSPLQINRVDQGFDLEYNQPTNVLAVAPGTVSIAGHDPGGFGVDYPLLTLDSPICGYSQIYYGHVHVLQSALGTHLNTGDTIANTDPHGVNSKPNWLEIGFWKDGPAAHVGMLAEVFATPPGYQMKNWLLGNGCGTNSTP